MQHKRVSPPHPGLTLRDGVLPALGLTVTDAAQKLKAARFHIQPAPMMAMA